MKNTILKYFDLPQGITEEEKPLYHYNCAEAILHAARDKYGLNLSEETLNAIIPFGGGMSSRRTCGIISGAVATIGIMFGNQKPCDQQCVRSVANEFVERFIKEFGSDQCTYLLIMKAPTEEKCRPVILRGCEILDEVIENNKDKIIKK
jgi:C_GCAxxG_C_C family probable redox protein